MARASTTNGTRFGGFADADGRFFRALAKNQKREWFQAHRAEYDQGWVAPMKLLLAEVRERIDPLFPRHALGDPKVFRINRDVRFSKDKSPYKTHIGGYVPLGAGGSGPRNPVPLYVQLGTEMFVGAGHYMMEPDQLVRYRAAVLDEKTGAALAKIVAGLEREVPGRVLRRAQERAARHGSGASARGAAQAEESGGRVPAAPEEAHRVARVRRLAGRARRARAPLRRVARRRNGLTQRPTDPVACAITSSRATVPRTPA
jgi:uncharacterized protein (TIGR02453 family)